jgi:hypothetical protein
VATVNLLEETLEKLERCGLTTADVRWVGWANGWQAIDWLTFTHHANQEYDNERGTPQVHHQLVVVGDNWWLERELVADQSDEIKHEQWVYRAMPELMKRERQSNFFFAFEKEERQAQTNLAYQQDLLKLKQMLYEE